MKQFLLERLIIKFPLLFNWESNEPICLFGIECDRGWNSIIEDLCYKLYKIKGLYVCQIKEKFGGLRFYVSYYNSEIRDLIGEAEIKSLHTCEICGGAEGKTQKVGIWLIKTVCGNCLKNY